MGGGEGPGNYFEGTFVLVSTLQTQAWPEEPDLWSGTEVSPTGV